MRSLEIEAKKMFRNIAKELQEGIKERDWSSQPRSAKKDYFARKIVKKTIPSARAELRIA